MRALTQMFKPPSADQLAVMQLEEMKRSLLEVQRHKEYYTAQETALLKGIERLTKHVQAVNSNQQLETR